MKLRKSNIECPPGDLAIGSYIKTERGYFYVHSKTQRFRFITERVLASWSPQRIVEVSESHAAVKRMRVTKKIKFRNGSLIWNISDGKIYLIESGKRRNIVSPEAFLRLGVDYNNLKNKVFIVSLAEINMHELGEDFA